MKRVRINVTLSGDLVEMLSNFGNKSRFIEESIRSRIDAIQKVKLNKMLKDGYTSENKEDEVISEEWDTATGDGIDDVS